MVWPRTCTNDHSVLQPLAVGDVAEDLRGIEDDLQAPFEQSEGQKLH